MKRIVLLVLIIFGISFGNDPVIVIGKVTKVNQQEIEVSVDIPVCRGNYKIKVDDVRMYKKGKEVLLYTKERCSDLKPLQER